MWEELFQTFAHRYWSGPRRRYHYHHTAINYRHLARFLWRNVQIRYLLLHLALHTITELIGTLLRCGSAHKLFIALLHRVPAPLKGNPQDAS